VLDADIKDYFVCINHGELLAMVKLRISDRRVLKLIRQWLEAGVMEGERFEKSSMGIPQGGVISPLLSNIYLNYFDAQWEDKYPTVGVLTRYADDFIIQCRSRGMVEYARQRTQRIFEHLYLTLHPEKTQVVDLGWGKQGFNFLGHYLRKARSVRYHQYCFLNRWPSQESMKKVRSRIHAIASYRSGVKQVGELVPKLNSLLRGWSNYFRSGNSTRKFLHVESYLWQRLVVFQNRRTGKKRPHWKREYNYEWFRSLGLYRLSGIIQYPNLVYANAYS
jgi:group II intron reverse transcriptase/maturase